MFIAHVTENGHSFRSAMFIAPESRRMGTPLGVRCSVHSTFGPGALLTEREDWLVPGL